MRGVRKKKGFRAMRFHANSFVANRSMRAASDRASTFV
jgi:hypothetical protein